MCWVFRLSKLKVLWIQRTQNMRKMEELYLWKAQGIFRVLTTNRKKVGQNPLSGNFFQCCRIDQNWDIQFGLLCGEAEWPLKKFYNLVKYCQILPNRIELKDEKVHQNVHKNFKKQTFLYVVMLYRRGSIFFIFTFSFF